MQKRIDYMLVMIADFWLHAMHNNQLID